MKLRGKLFIVTALILSMLLGLTCLAFAQPADIQGHWAEAQIGKWLEQKLATGYPDGSFGPDNSITRAEFVALVNRVFGFTASEPINYPDVAPDAWFSDEIARKAAGYLSGYEDGTIRPNGQISRQEAALILAKVAIGSECESGRDRSLGCGDNSGVEQRGYCGRRGQRDHYRLPGSNLPTGKTNHPGGSNCDLRPGSAKCGRNDCLRPSRYLRSGNRAGNNPG